MPEWRRGRESTMESPPGYEGRRRGLVSRWYPRSDKAVPRSRRPPGRAQARPAACSSPVDGAPDRPPGKPPRPASGRGLILLPIVALDRRDHQILLDTANLSKASSMKNCFEKASLEWGESW